MPIVIENEKVTNVRRCIPLAFYKAIELFSSRGIRRASTPVFLVVRGFHAQLITYYLIPHPSSLTP